MRIAIFGISGMLGSALWSSFQNVSDFDVVGFTRNPENISLTGKTTPDKLRRFSFDHTSASELFTRGFRPDVIINCVGVRKNPESIRQIAAMFHANSVWPQQLASIAKQINARLILFSTDAVFSGNKGMYREDDAPDPASIYGESKLLGEVVAEKVLTIRTSIIGHLNPSSDQLLDWLIRQKGRINGFDRVFFSGLTTLEIAHLLKAVILPEPNLNGVWHVAGERVSKRALIEMVISQYNLDIELVPVSEPERDLSLDATRFQSVTGYTPPSWSELIARLRETRV